jgi:hypothetical protein
VEIVLVGNSSWMPYAPQGVKGPDDDDLILFDFPDLMLLIITARNVFVL